MALEQPSLLLEELGSQTLNSGSADLESLESAIDGVSLNDVKEVVSRVLKGKVAIAAVGQTANVPYLEDLV